MTPLPYGRQSIGAAEIEAVVEVLKSDFLTQGPTIVKFESALADYVGARYAVAVANGTAALHLANLALENPPGYRAITTPNTFVATSNSVIYAGGEPIFADIDAATFNIDVGEVQKRLAADSTIAGILPVHFAGLVTDLPALREMAAQYDCWIIEDASHAIGGRWTDAEGVERRVGDCSYSNMTIFSFHPVKNMTTGEGGAITTNDSELYRKLLTLRTHGITKQSDILQENHGGWYYEMHDLGFNYRMTDIQAALGVVQLGQCDGWADRRRALVARYDAAFDDVPEIVPQLHPAGSGMAYHLYVVRAQRRKELYDFLRSQEIYSQVHYIPVHLQPYYCKKFGTGTGDFPATEAYYSEALSLPLFPKLSEADQDRVIAAVRTFYA